MVAPDRKMGEKKGTTVAPVIWMVCRSSESREERALVDEGRKREGGTRSKIRFPNS